MGFTARFLLLWGAFLAFPAVAAAQSDELTLERVWTQDGGGADTSSFQPGDGIRYAGMVRNPSDILVATATITLTARGPLSNCCTEIFSYVEEYEEIPPGLVGFYRPSTIPSNAQNGEYEFILSVDDAGGGHISGTSRFTITSGVEPPSPPDPPEPPAPPDPPSPPDPPEPPPDPGAAPIRIDRVFTHQGGSSPWDLEQSTFTIGEDAGPIEFLLVLEHLSNHNLQHGAAISVRNRSSNTIVYTQRFPPSTCLQDLCTPGSFTYYFDIFRGPPSPGGIYDISWTVDIVGYPALSGTYTFTVAAATAPQPPDPTPANHPPVIKLRGDNPLQLTTGCPPLDPGATATDPEDGDITNRIRIHRSVDVDVPGTYTYTYSVTDSAGLPANERTRQVIVFAAIGTSACFSTTPKGQAPNLVILVHGCCTNADDIASVWNPLANHIAGVTNKQQAWEIVVWDWHTNKHTGQEQTPPPPGLLDKAYLERYGDIAYQYAIVEGRRLAAVIDRYPAYKYIHFIAHSAGARLITTASQELAVRKARKHNGKPFLHLTFLDAYTHAADAAGAGSYGTLPNNHLSHFAESYVDRSPPLNPTNELLSGAFNFDITDWKCAPSVPSDEVSDCKDEKGTDLGHAWPRFWYERSIARGFTNYGSGLSREGGNKEYPSLSAQFHAGECRALLDSNTVGECASR